MARAKIRTQYLKWIDRQKLRVEAGELSGLTVREYARYARYSGELDFWGDSHLSAITASRLDDWNLQLAQSGLSGKTRRNILGAFRTFCNHLARRDKIKHVPIFPVIRVSAHTPKILSTQEQTRVLDACKTSVERLSHAIPATCALRPSELRALEIRHYLGFSDGIPRLRVESAMPTKSAEGEPRFTKNRDATDLPIPNIIAEQIEKLWTSRRRLRESSRSPLVWNPHTQERWSHAALRKSWLKACKSAGLGHVPLYEGTKHSAATDMLAKSGDLSAVQRYLRHRDQRSTLHYAKVVDHTLVEIAQR